MSEKSKKTKGCMSHIAKTIDIIENIESIGNIESIENE